MKTLFGNQSERCCGFCKLHHVGITPNQIKKRHCLTPTWCKHFRKIADSEYWEKETIRQKHIAKQKTESQLLRKQRKAEKKIYFEKLDKQRTDNTHIVTSKPKLSRETSGKIVASYGTDIPSKNPFAILATKCYPDKQADCECDEYFPFTFDNSASV